MTATCWACATIIGRWRSWSSVATARQIWAEPFTRLRIPKIFNLRTDPYERADQTSNTYWEWYIHHIYLLYGAQAAAAQWAATFKDFPPVQKPNTFTLDDALRMMHETASGMH